MGDSNYHINRRHRLATFAYLKVLDLVASIYAFISYFGSCLSYYYFQLMLSVDMFVLLSAFLSQICRTLLNSRYFLLHVCLDVRCIHNYIYNYDCCTFYAFHNADRSALNTLLKFSQVQSQRLRVCTLNIQDVCQSSIEITFAECSCASSCECCALLLQHLFDCCSYLTTFF